MVLPFKWNLFSSIFTWFQTVEIKPVVFADGQENYWLWYSASHHQKNTTCPEKDSNKKINKGAPSTASVGWRVRNHLSLACVQTPTPLPSDFSWGEGRSVHGLHLLHPVMKRFTFSGFPYDFKLTLNDTNLLHCVCSKPHCWHSAPKESKSHNNW